MGFYKIIFSPTGGTQKAADLLETAWIEAGRTGVCSVDFTEGQNIDLSVFGREYSEIPFEKEDVCLVAVPSYGGRVPEPAVMKLKAMKGNGARTVLLVAYGNRAYEDTLLELYDTVTQAGFSPVAGVTAIAEHSILRQFASGRPDEEDKEVLTEYSRKILEKINNGHIWKREDVPGKKPYREFDGTIKPAGDKSCTGCGNCAKVCPVGAIPGDRPQKTREERCISCMRCVQVCPAKARRVNKMLLFAASQKLKKACSGRKDNELFL